MDLGKGGLKKSSKPRELVDTYLACQKDCVASLVAHATLSLDQAKERYEAVWHPAAEAFSAVCENQQAWKILQKGAYLAKTFAAMRTVTALGPLGDHLACPGSFFAHTQVARFLTRICLWQIMGTAKKAEIRYLQKFSDILLTWVVHCLSASPKEDEDRTNVPDHRFQMLEDAAFLICLILVDAPAKVKRAVWTRIKPLLPCIVDLLPHFEQSVRLVNVAKVVSVLVTDNKDTLTQDDVQLVRSLAAKFKEQVQRGRWKACENSPANLKSIRGGFCTIAVRLSKFEAFDAAAATKEQDPADAEMREDKGNCAACGKVCANGYCKCSFVQYCGQECEKRHRAQHKLTCKTRLDLLHEYGDQEFRKASTST